MSSPVASDQPKRCIISSAPRKSKFTQKGPIPLADFVSHAVGDAFSKFGFSQGDLVLHWADIVGAKLAANCRPQKLQWPRPPRKGHDQKPDELATLILQVEGHAALEVQHMAATILQRVNNFLGWRCIGKLSLRQAPLPKANAARSPARPGPASLAKAQDLTSEIDDAQLRAALIRLGAQILSQK
eukprot:gene8973-9053_t